ncbi:MAG: 3-oxoadipate enol-lactonase [Granulosicoccus sp.]|nr:3-oxoadipate enol-lactonase [Granulosicoccus sp.]
MKVNIGHCSINLERSGNTSGPSVVMAHSLGCNLHMWAPQMASLEADFDVIRLDMRGHGLSDAPEGPYTLDELADDVIAVMDELEVSQAHWVGLSIGGMIGQSLLLRYPERFDSAVLCDTMSALPEGASAIWDERIKTVETDGLGSIKQATLERWFTSDFLASGAPEIAAVAEQIDQATDTGYIGCCHAISGLDYMQRLGDINTSVLIIAGAEDVATPVSASQAMQERIPGSRLVVISDAAHIANVEQPQAFNDALMPFLQRAKATR